MDDTSESAGAMGKVVAGAFCTIAVLAMWNWFGSRFVPNAAGRAGALVVATLSGAGMVAWVIFGPPFRKGSKGLADLSARSPPMAAAPVRAILCGGFTFMLAYCAAEGAAWEAWTWAFGKPGGMTVHVAQYVRAGRRSCAGLNFDDAPVFLRQGVCVSYERDDDAPSPGSAVRLEGRRSGLGIDVEHFTVLENATPYQP